MSRIAMLLLAASVPLPSVGNLATTCLVYAALGYGLARIRWWASLPILLFLVLTLSATFKRLGDLRAASALEVIPPHYLAYHAGATVLAAVVILYGIHQQRSRRSVRSQG